MSCPYNPIHSEEWLTDFLNKKFNKKTYSPFSWWRSYKPKKTPLHNRSKTIDKIKNGDFDLASYKYEVELIEHKLKRSWNTHYPDITRFLEENSLDLARVKRLKEDIQKDENIKLEHLYKCLKNDFGWDKDTSMNNLARVKGESLTQVYKNLSKINTLE